MPGISLSPLTEADLEDVARIEQVAFPRTSTGDEPDDSNGMTIAQLREELARPWARLRVARESGKAVAFLLTWHVVDEIHVLNVAVAPEHRRRGIARALMRELLAFASEKRARQLLLEVRRGNRAAIDLYRSLGFHAFGLRKRYYSNDEDAVEMALALDPDSGRVVPGKDEVRLDG